MIVTSGGWDPQARQWLHLRLCAVSLAPQEVAVASADHGAPDRADEGIQRLVDACYRHYREGFVTNIQKGDVPSRYQSLATYSRNMW